MASPSRPRPLEDGDARVIACATGLLLAGVLPQLLTPALVVAMREDFALSASALGVAAGISFGVSALVSPLAGRAVAGMGLRRSLALAALLTGGSSLVLALFADGAGAVIALLAVNGLGNGLGSPAAARLVAGRVRAARQGTAFGLLTSAPQMGVFAAGLSLPLIALPLSWRAAFVAPAVVGAACLAALWRTGEVAAPAPERSEDPAERRPRRLSPVHLLSLSTVLVSAAGIGMRSFLVVFAVSRGIDASAAGLLFSAAGLLAIVTRIGFGILGDRRGSDPLPRAAALMMVSCTGFALMAVGGPPLIVVGTLLAAGVGWGWQAPLTAAVVTISPHATASAIGVQMAGFFLGAVLGPILVGMLVAGGDYALAWSVCAALAVGAAGLTVLARQRAAGTPAVSHDCM